MKKAMISSTAHEEIKKVAKLATAKERSVQGRFIAEGLRICTTLIQAGYKPEKIYLQNEDQLKTFESLVSPEIITLVAPHVMEKMSQTTTPSGVLAVFPIPPKPSLSLLTQGLVLAQITDPGNLGTLMRTAAAMGKKTIVLVSTTDPYSPKVVQSSAGSLAALTIFRLDWPTLIKAKQKLNLRLIGLTASGGQEPSSIDFHNSLLVVGNEAHGIPDPWLAQCDQTMTLPMPGGIESLNAAVAGSIALYLTYKY